MNHLIIIGTPLAPIVYKGNEKLWVRFFIIIIIALNNFFYNDILLM